MNPNAPEPAAPSATVPDRDDRGLTEPALSEMIATGDRCEEIHFEPDPDQLVVVRHEVRPRGPLPPQDPSAAVGTAGAPPVEDVRIVPPAPSIWDARPPDADG